MEIDEIHTHPLTSENICEPTKEKLSDNVTDRRGNLDTEILVRSERRCAVVIDNTEHRCDDGNRENVVGIGEETDTGNQTDLHVEPAKGVV